METRSRMPEKRQAKTNVERSAVMAENQDKKDKKIIIDEDWKKEAQREKEILAAQEEPSSHERIAPRI